MDNPPMQNKMLPIPPGKPCRCGRGWDGECKSRNEKGGYIVPPQLSGMINPCRLPPQGWKCTRDAGHSGPCAAIHDILPIQHSGRPMPRHLAAKKHPVEMIGTICEDCNTRIMPVAPMCNCGAGV